MAVRIQNPEAGIASPTRLSYFDDYLVEHADHLNCSDERTVSERYPLQFEVWPNATWPAFLLDMMPSGAARQWWARRLAGEVLAEGELDFVLLRDHTISPIGNLRIASGQQEERAPIPFTKEQVCERDVGFLEYAADLGAAIGGATGAGGDAPKVLLSEDADGNVYPDGGLPDEQIAACWLVKWPRGRDTDRDRLILHTEYIYSHVLADLGLETCPGEWREVEGGKPSLWLPRFDRVVRRDGVERLAAESFYSLAGIAQPGAVVSHETFLAALESALQHRGQADRLSRIVKDYVCRGLLDVVLGNSDNHGRNRAVIRSDELRLAPIYDLAPMVMDPEGVTRSSRWSESERGGRIDWPEVCRDVGRWVAPDEMLETLREFAQRLLALPDLLNDAGLDDEVMAFPRIHLRDLPRKLEAWGLR